jgi:hypothetical protein
MAHKTSTLKSLLFFIALLSITSFGFGQEIASFSSLQNSACSGTIYLDGNITGTGICRGSGIVETAGLTYNSRNWTNNGTLDTDDYLEWSLTPNSGYQIDLISMQLRYDRSPADGPSMADIQVDTGSGFSSIYNDTSVSPSGENAAINLSTLIGIEGTITFRLYAFNSGGGGGTFDIEELIAATNKGIIINGAVSVLNSCLTVTTWNGTTWDNGNPDLTTVTIIDANYNTATTSIGSFSACSLIVNNGARLTIADGDYVEVQNDVVVDGGVIRVESKAAFVQRGDNTSAGTFTLINGGNSNVFKYTANKLKWYYYTYWSSPVDNETVDGAFPDTATDRRFKFNAANYLDLNGDGYDDTSGWQIVSGGTQLIPGVGYAATSSPFGLYPGSDSADFNGAFNTGNITIGISYNALNVGGSWNFIGNPYPCALDFNAFYEANSSVIDGVAYFWSQSTPPSSSNPGNEVSNFSQNDYATYSYGASAGIAGASMVEPTPYVPSAQGFFVGGKTNNTVTFTNSMRMADETSNLMFFKTSNKKGTSSDLANKLWVNLTSDNGVFGQTLVAYVDGATNENDGPTYDAQKLTTNGTNAILYSKINGSDNNFAIQCKAPNSLNENEVINLGFKSTITVPTLYKLSVAKLEGAFLTSNTIFLVDTLLNKVHDLSASDYTFTSAAGEFNSRFSIAFTNKALSVNDVLLNTNALKIVELQDDFVQFNTSSNLTIKSVHIYDLLGRQLYQFKGENTSETYRLSHLNNSVYVAKVALSNGVVVTKKAVKK